MRGWRSHNTDQDFSPGMEEKKGLGVLEGPLQSYHWRSPGHLIVSTEGHTAWSGMKGSTYSKGSGGQFLSHRDRAFCLNPGFSLISLLPHPPFTVNHKQMRALLWVLEKLNYHGFPVESLKKILCPQMTGWTSPNY